jgi:hypothetical protein
VSDYRVTITIPNLPIEAEGQWGPFITRLERSAAAGGPILAWDRGDAQVLIAVSGPDEAGAARVALTQVIDSLRATDLADRYPSRLEFEPEQAGEPVPV